MLLACMVVCGSVFHNSFDIMGLCVASWTGIVGRVIQLLLITQESWVMSARKPGQLDSVLARKCCFSRMDVERGGGLPCSCVLSLRLDGLARNLSMDAVMEAGSGWERRE